MTYVSMMSQFLFISFLRDAISETIYRRGVKSRIVMYKNDLGLIRPFDCLQNLNPLGCHLVAQRGPVFAYFCTSDLVVKKREVLTVNEIAISNLQSCMNTAMETVSKSAFRRLKNVCSFEHAIREFRIIESF